MSIPNKKVIAVLPAYNAAKTLKNTLGDIPMEWIDEVILVDDASKDNTAELAQSLGIKTIVHRKNIGYGGNQKTCYREALNMGADIIIMIHPDHQYDPALVPQMLAPLINERADAVFGSRMMIKDEALKGGMPLWKYIANGFLTKLENFILGIHLTEFHSGFRAYTKNVLVSIAYEFNSDNFVFDTEIIVQLINKGFKIKEIPIPTRYFKEASTVGFVRGMNYGVNILKVLLEYKLHKWDIKKYEKFR